jgi:hypothetical protein
MWKSEIFINHEHDFQQRMQQSDRRERESMGMAVFSAQKRKKKRDTGGGGGESVMDGLAGGWEPS